MGIWADKFWSWTFWHPPSSHHMSGVLLANLVSVKISMNHEKTHKKVKQFSLPGLIILLTWEWVPGRRCSSLPFPSAWAFHTTWWIQGEIWKGLYCQLCNALEKRCFCFERFLRCLLVPFSHIYFLIDSLTKAKYSLRALSRIPFRNGLPSFFCI